MIKIESGKIERIQPSSEYQGIYPPVYDTSIKERILPFEPSRPILDVPGATTPLALSFSKLADSITFIESTLLAMTNDRLIELQKSHFRNYEKQLSQNHKLKDEIDSHNYWSYIYRIANCLSAAAMGIAAFMVISSGFPGSEFAAAALITSSIATITGAALREIGLHPEIASSLIVVGSLIGLLGSGATAYYSSSRAQEMMGKVLMGAIALLNNLSEGIKEHHAKNIAEIKSENAETNLFLERDQDHMVTLFKSIETSSEGVQESIEELTRALNAYERALRTTVSLQELRA